MILLIGPGAVGTILAAHLMQAAREPLTLYVRERNLTRMTPLTQLRMDYSDATRAPLLTARPQLTTTLDLHGVDYVFICVKYPDLDALLDQLPPIPPTCTLVSTLNGVSALRRIRERLPQVKVVPMTVMFNGQLPGPLHARITTKAEVIIGSADARLLSSFAGSGMKVKRAEGETAVWGKLLINLANAVCALTHTTFRDLLTQPDLRRIFVAVLDEAVALLEQSRLPYQLPAPIPHRAYRQLLLHGGPIPWWFAQLKNGLQDGAYPSMVSDIEAGRATEVEQLNGEILRLAQQCGTQAPINAKLTELVTAMHGQLPPPYLTPGDLRQQLGI
jgi:2-dehydropantoate 2-reductase